VPVPLKFGMQGVDSSLFGRGPGEDTSAPIWGVTMIPVTPSNVTTVISRARTYGIIVMANLAGARTTWTDNVNGKLHFNQTKYETQVKRFKPLTTANPGGCSQAVADAVALAFTDRVFINYYMDEANHPDFDGTIPPSTLNNLGLFVKSLWPDSLTLIRMAADTLQTYQGGTPSGGYSGIDYGCAWYTNVRKSQTPHQFWLTQAPKFAALDIGMTPGVNWVNSPFDQVWDTDNDPLTADARILGQGSPTPGVKVTNPNTTSNWWLASPAFLKSVFDEIKLVTGTSGQTYLDFPFCTGWTDPRSLPQENIWMPYFTRSDFVAAWDYGLNQFATRASWTGWRTPKGQTVTPPPPTNISYAYSERATSFSTGSSTYVEVPLDSVTLGGVVVQGIPAAFFTAGHQYLLYVTADVDLNSNNFSDYVQIVHGTTAFAQSEASVQTSNLANRQRYVFMTRWTAIASETIKMQARVEAGSGKTVTVDNLTVFALDVTGLTHSRNLNSVSTALSGVYADGASVTFTPATAGHDWLILTHSQYTTPSITQSIKSRINISGGATATDPEVMREADDAVNDIVTLNCARVVTLPAVATTIKEQSANTGGGGPRVSSEIFVLDMNQFAAHAFAYDNAQLDYADGTIHYQTQVQHAQITNTADSDVWFLGSHAVNLGVAGGSCHSRMQVNNVDAPAIAASAEYYRHINWDATDLLPVIHSAVVNCPSGPNTVDLDADLLNAGTGRGGKGRCVVAIQLGNASTGVDTPPVWTAIPDFNIKEGETVSFTAVASDLETVEANLVYSAVTVLPGGAVFTPSNRHFVWTPSNDQAGTYTITLRVTDVSGNSVDETFIINVEDVPTPIDFTKLRSLRFDHDLQGGRLQLHVTWNGGATELGRHGITGMIVEMSDMGRI
jgi:hypothetical protein